MGREGFVIRFADDEFLYSYCDDGQVRVAGELGLAKTFRRVESAESAAKILGGSVQRILTDHDGSNPRLALNQREPAPVAIVPDSPSSDLELILRCVVENAGATFQGIQKGHGKIPDLVLFTDSTAPRDQRSTCAIPFLNISTQSVRNHIAAMRQKFAGIQ